MTSRRIRTVRGLMEGHDLVRATVEVEVFSERRVVIVGINVLHPSVQELVEAKLNDQP